MAIRNFLRFLSIIYFIAFASLLVQVLGLVGSQGILPVGEFLGAAKNYYGPRASQEFPTLCWLNHSDAFLLVLCWGGMIASVFLFSGILPTFFALALWVLYLSLTVAGQDFLGFQWDNLLLEAGFIGIFLYPLCLKINDQRHESSKLMVWALRLLLFKLMFQSGLVKWFSHDASWRDLTALTYHYWTQPLPNPVSWYAAQLPQWFHQASCVVMFAIEWVVPFFIFLGSRMRMIAFWFLVVFQVLIIATGNYGFFNLLAIALAFTLIEDKPIYAPVTRMYLWKMRVIFILFLLLSFFGMLSMLNRQFIQKLSPIVRAVAPFRSINNYGLFAVMTKERDEIEFEGSVDGAEWKPYGFYYKPSDVKEIPKWAMPYQPRLDWQMWFAALSDYRQNLWAVNTMVRLMQGSKEVELLFKENPFKDEKPRYMRAMLYSYHFTNHKELKEGLGYWKRTAKGYYIPEVSLTQ